MRTISLFAALAVAVGGALSLGSSPARSTNSTTPRVLITVTGHAPKGVKITYGHSGDVYAGKFPLHQELPYSTNYFNYYVKAKLKNGGNITCKVSVGSKTKVGHAKGGHHLCTAQLKNDGQGGWR